MHTGGAAFRTPLLPLATLDRLTGGAARAAWLAGASGLAEAVDADLGVLRAGLRDLLADPSVRTAIAYASPSLDAAIDRDLDAVVRPVLAYVARMAGRTASFGLFAGVTAGGVEGMPAYDIAGRSAIRRRTRLDVGLLAGVAARITVAARDVPLPLVPNTTCHVAGGRLRLVEREAGRFHPLAVETDEALAGALAAARDGATRLDVATALAGDGVSLDDALAFVDDLVDVQVLVPDLGPALTAGDPAAPMVATLRTSAGTAPVADTLDRAAALVRDLDTGPLDAAKLRVAVSAVREMDPALPPGRGVHLDVSRPAESLVLGDPVLAEAYRAVEVLHPLARVTSVDQELRAFSAAFATRYGAAEVPLLAALDDETGIGFGAPTALGAAGAPLLSGLMAALGTGGPEWTPIDHHLVDLMSRALRTGAREIDLGPADLGPLRNPDQRPLPDAVAVVATVVAASAEAVAAGTFRLLVHEVSGPGGAALLSRFADLDPGLDALVRAHLDAEERLRPDAVYAEVVHLPEGRAANLAARPPLGRYEIPVLGIPAAPPDRRIPLADLRVSVAGDRVVLRSARLGREVVPRLTAAHDWYASPLRAYRFLAAVGRAGRAGSLRWSWGQVQSAPYLPRVVTGRLVLSRAQWHWFKPDLLPLRDARTAVERYAAVQRLRDEWDVARRVTLAMGDQEIPVDLDGVGAAELLAHEARRAGQVTLREQYPGPDELCVRGPDGAYVHDVVLPLVMTAPAAGPVRVMPPQGRAYLPGSAWVAARIGCGVATADTVLRDAVAPIAREADAWSFSRDDGGLRVRWRGVPASRLSLDAMVESGAVWDVAYETYRAEPEAVVTVAHADSDAALALLGEDLDARWRAAFWGIDGLLAGRADRRRLVREWRDALVAAYGETGARARRWAGRVWREQRPSAPDPDVAKALETRNARAAQALRDLDDEALAAACAAHANRVLRAAQQVQELVLYDLLDRHYRASEVRGRQR